MRQIKAIPSNALIQCFDSSLLHRLRLGSIERLEEGGSEGTSCAERRATCHRQENTWKRRWRIKVGLRIGFGVWWGGIGREVRICLRPAPFLLRFLTLVLGRGPRPKHYPQPRSRTLDTLRQPFLRICMIDRIREWRVGKCEYDVRLAFKSVCVPV
jgi:hypothetical protein